MASAAIRVPLPPWGSIGSVGEGPLLQAGVLVDETQLCGEMAAHQDDARLEARAHPTQQVAAALVVTLGVGEGGEQDDRVADLAGQAAAQSLLGLVPDYGFGLGQTVLGQEGIGSNIVGPEHGGSELLEPGDGVDRPGGIPERIWQMAASLAARGVTVRW